MDLNWLSCCYGDPLRHHNDRVFYKYLNIAVWRYSIEEDSSSLQVKFLESVETDLNHGKSSLRSKCSCSTEELRNDFPQAGRAEAPTSARPVCGKSFRSSSVEQEHLLRRLRKVKNGQ